MKYFAFHNNDTMLKGGEMSIIERIRDKMMLKVAWLEDNHRAMGEGNTHFSMIALFFPPKKKKVHK